MNKQGKRTAKCQADCKQHKVRVKIKPCSSNKLEQTIQLSFCPQLPCPSPTSTILPVPNHFKQPYYPMFIQPHCVPKVKTMGNQYKKQFYSVKERHQLYLSVDHKQKETVYQPKPRSNICRVCDCKIGNYVEHIREQGHVGRLREERVVGIMEQIVGEFEQVKRRGKQEEKEDQFLAKITQANVLMKKFKKMLTLINNSMN